MPDERPPVAIGHMTLQVGDIARSTRFFEQCGLRRVIQRDAFAILELRGGTHLLLFPAKRKLSGKKIQKFDLMVDDVRQFRQSLQEKQFHVTEIRKDSLGGHLWFEVTDPDGRALAVYSTHTEGRPV